MASKPRRTSELGELSEKRSARISRIAQPIHRPHQRGQSLDRLSIAHGTNNAGAGSVPGSTLKPKRSNSATPLRTPKRPIPCTGILTTNEKERAPLDDKKWVQAQANKILDYLHVIEPVLGKEFFQRGGLKSMSTKQFITIINHFLKFIAGNRFTVGGNNYIDDIVKILAQIEYPYNINKSWLKTPTAPHSFSNIVVLLSWFLTFVPNEEAVQRFEKDISTVREYLLDQEYTLLFMRSIAVGFNLWNNSKDDEHESLKLSLVDAFIQKQTGVKDLVTIENETNKLNREYDELIRHKVVVKKEDEFFKLDQEIKNKKKILLKLEDLCKDNGDKLDHLKNTCDNKVKLINNIQEQITNLKEKIESQQMSVKGRENLITEVHYLKQLLESKKESVLKLQDMGSTNQILLSRLMKKKIELISEFNNYIYKVFTDPINSVNNVQDLCLDQYSEVDLTTQIKNLIPRLEDVKHKNNELFIEYTKSIVDIENQLKMAVGEHDTILEQRLKDVLKRCEESLLKIEEIDFHIINTKSEQLKKIDELTLTLVEQKDLAQKYIDEIESKEMELQALRTENAAMVDRSLQKGEEILKQKEENINNLQKAVTLLQNTIRQVSLKMEDVQTKK